MVKQMKKLISLVIPCYNEQESIVILYDEIKKVSYELERYELEYIFVDDGSDDKTLEILKELSKDDKRVRYISFSKNFGKESAMYAGLCNARGDYVAILDADMQDPPMLLPEMIKHLETQDYDSVATRRVTRKGEPIVRSAFARMFYRIMNRISDADIMDGARDFRLMKRPMVDAIVTMSEHNRFSKGIFGWVGFRTYWIPYENAERVAGKTKWNFWKLLKYSVDGIISFSNTPVSLIFLLGALLLFAGVVLAAVCAIGALLLKVSVDNWIIILFAAMLILGLQLIALGILGKYITNINAEVKKRPHYIIAETNDINAERIR